jgi:hypothetical protein
VKLVAYADESGTDSGPGSDLLTVAGWVAPCEDWANFCPAWDKVLKQFAAGYFHFREWSMASAVVRKKRQPSSEFKDNPYQGWAQSKLDDFLFSLATVAASGNRLIVGGYVPPNMLRQDQLHGLVDTEAAPDELCLGHFFKSVITTINRERPPWKRQPVAFFFDHSTNKAWKKLVNDGFNFSRQNRQFRELAFARKQDHLPLQAADMVAYRLRQVIEKRINWDFSESRWPKLDEILFKSINQRFVNLSQDEKEGVLRRFFVIPENATYEQAMDSINANRRDSR